MTDKERFFYAALATAERIREKSVDRHNITIFMTEEAADLFKTPYTEPEKEGYIPTLFGYPVELLKGKGIRMYIAQTEEQGVNDGKSLDGE